MSGLQEFHEAESAFYKLFGECGISQVESVRHVRRFALSTEHLPMRLICRNMQTKIREDGLLDVCMEIDECSESHEILGVLGADYTPNGDGKEIVIIVKCLAASLFELAPAAA